MERAPPAPGMGQKQLGAGVGRLPPGWTWFIKRLLTGAWKCAALGPSDANRSSSRGELVCETNHAFNTTACGESVSAREPAEKTESNYIPNCLLKLVEITHNSMCATAL